MDSINFKKPNCEILTYGSLAAAAEQRRPGVTLTDHRSYTMTDKLLRDVIVVHPEFRKSTVISLGLLGSVAVTLELRLSTRHRQ